MLIVDLLLLLLLLLSLSYVYNERNVVHDKKREEDKMKYE